MNQKILKVIETGGDVQVVFKRKTQRWQVTLRYNDKLRLSVTGQATTYAAALKALEKGL